MTMRLLAVTILVLAAPAAAAAEPEARPWFDLAVALAVVLAAGVLGWWLLRRRRWRAGGKGPVEIVHVIALGARERLVVVRAGEEYLLLGATPTQINCLRRLRWEGEMKAPAAQEERPAQKRAPTL